MPVLVRPIAEADYAPVARLVAEAAPEQAAQVAGWRQADAQADPARRTVRYLALYGEPPELVGYGAFWLVHGQHYRIDLLVAPAWRRRGVGGRLLSRLVDALVERGATSLQARADEEDLETLTFLRSYGFVETQRMVRLRLELAGAKLELARQLEPRLARQGLALTDLAYERAHTPEYLHRLHDLHVAGLPDWPRAEPGPAPALAFDEFQRRFAQRALLPEGCFVARQGDLYVGYSGLAADAAAPGQLIAAGTVVRPAWRQRGIATALKLRTVAYAQRCGYASTIAHTASPTMLAIDERLGFRRERAEVRLLFRL